MQNRTVTATEFKNRTGQYIDVASGAPVFISRYGRTDRVLISFETYQDLLGKSATSKLASDNVLAALRTHEAELKEMGVIRLDLFGSVARGEAIAGSDIDLLVTFKPGAKIGLKFVRIKQRLEEILQASVDLVRAPVANKDLLANIKSDIINAF